MEVKTYKMSQVRATFFILLGLLFLLPGLLFMPLLIIGIIFVIFILLEYSRTNLSITPRGILMRGGVINVRTVEIPFDKINTILVARGLLGNMFGYGNILFMTGSNIIARFPGVNNPEALRDEIMRITSEKVNTKLQENSKSTNSYGELNELAALKEKGIITEQDFNAKKKQILGI